MHHIITLLALLAPALVSAQLAAGGGLGAPQSVAAVQYPVVTNAPSLVTQGAVTTTVRIAFTQTFAATALGTWDLGPTPLVGTIGLGSIQGNVGNVVSKRDQRSIETPAPERRWAWQWGTQ